MEAVQKTIPGVRAPFAGRDAVVGLVIGVVCGLATWGVVQATFPAFAVPAEFHIEGIGAPVERHQAFAKQQDIVDRRHLMLYLAVLGALLSGTLRVAWDRSLPLAAVAATNGLIGGALAGTLTATYFVTTRNQGGQGDLLHPFLRQLLVGVPFGAWIGLRMPAGRGLAAMGRGLFAGALGGLVFSALYVLLVAIGLPEANTESLLPEEAVTRLLWLVTLGGTIGLAIGMAVGRSRSAAQSVAASPP